MSVRKKHVRDKKKNRPTKGNTKCAIAWYKPDQWDLLKKLSVDSEKMEDTHQEWLHYAEAKLMEFREEGFDVNFIEVDIGELLSWCNERSLPINSKSRSEFASRKLMATEKKKDNTA